MSRWLRRLRIRRAVHLLLHERVLEPLPSAERSKLPLGWRIYRLQEDR